MAQLYTKVKLYLEANSKTWDDTKVSLQNNNDGNGDFGEEQLFLSQAFPIESLNFSESIDLGSSVTK